MGNTHNAFLMKKTALALSGKTAEDVNDKQKQMDKIRQNVLKFRQKAAEKISPYDIRPDIPPREAIDLSEFLTDMRSKISQSKNIDAQCDEFLSKPDTPPYIEKKTGLDADTQIQDN